MDSCVLKSVDFGRFMTPEGTKTYILAFTSKTGQSVAHNRHGIFLFYFSVREKIYLGICHILIVHIFYIHYAITPMQYIAIFHGCKNVNFQMKNYYIFLIFAQNIDCAYTLELEAVLLKEKNVYPCTPQFYYIKEGCKGVLHGHVFVMYFFKKIGIM